MIHRSVEPGICISNKLSGNADVLWPKAHTLGTIDKRAVALCYNIVLPHIFTVNKTFISGIKAVMIKLQMS